MSSGGALARLVICLGFLVLLAQLMYPVNGPPSFNSFSSGFPNFNNPFSAKTVHFFPNAEGPKPTDLYGNFGQSHNSSAVTNCVMGNTNDNTTTYGCVRTPDETISYVSIINIAGGFSFSENLSGFTGDSARNWRIVSVTFGVECSSEDPTMSLFMEVGNAPSFIFSGSTGQINFVPNPLHCATPLGTFSNLTTTADATAGGFSPTQFSGVPITISITTLAGAKIAWVSNVFVDVTYQASGTCVFAFSGNPWDDVSRATAYVGCVIAAVGYFFIDLGSFGFNLVIYIFSWSLTIIIFLGSIASTLLWFYAIPGINPTVQTFVSAFVTAVIALMIYNIAKLVRGTGP